ncbi:LacI family DNA-binding transcriptional regulator [Gynurincola endophyticus]|uniref:LacI family DNA-binding transcriptional regulator n=1 Tax=Gynurincola endophyticus TaxID=2479004 RepID=UPI000F8CE4DD|nr:LacI family DNA-binding transcriptional regulator [Gynurincola endophyticus]
MRKKTSMKDIAAQLGVSTALVSYVLNDKYPDRINAHTAQKIRDLAAELQYQPNQIAKSLKNAKTFTIGLIIADISNLFYSSIARVIEDEAKLHQYNVIFGSADENLTKFEELLKVFVSRQVDGIILASPEGSESCFQFLTERNIPFVVIDRFYPNHKDVNAVFIDNYKASFEAIEHLSQQGFKNTALVTLASKLHHLQLRTKGFEDGAKQFQNNICPTILEIPEDILSEEVEKRILQLLKNRNDIDSVYFTTNKIAIEGLAVLAKYKIAVPHDVGVICFDEADAYKIFNTSITYIKQPLRQIGHEVVELLMSLMNGNKLNKHIMLDTTLVEGNSSKMFC